ncbi:hypothetical protein CFAM422_013196 [Trichoderma lentiforme]|uniref:Uncharacterized protein n=1 Tax=Trichoderma lentiforme TaxID=1567552 RepID=A0A9P4X3J7_9HYPO|nr:hypothetical protein CFAM422_013196 [Trichoderma lentiforme]
MFGGWTDMKPSHLFRTVTHRTGAGAVGRETENNAETSQDSGRGALANQVSATWGGARVQFSISRAETCDAQRGKGPDNVR